MSFIVKMIYDSLNQ